MSTEQAEASATRENHGDNRYHDDEQDLEEPRLPPLLFLLLVDVEDEEDASRAHLRAVYQTHGPVGGIVQGDQEPAFLTVIQGFLGRDRDRLTAVDVVPVNEASHVHIPVFIIFILPVNPHRVVRHGLVATDTLPAIMAALTGIDGVLDGRGPEMLKPDVVLLRPRPAFPILVQGLSDEIPRDADVIVDVRATVLALLGDPDLVGRQGRLGRQRRLRLRIVPAEPVLATTVVRLLPLKPDGIGSPIGSHGRSEV